MKKLIAILVSMGMLLTGFSSASATGVSFSDISGHWAEETIIEWSGYEIIQGYNGEFRPDDAITRGEMAVILNRLMDYQVAANNPFSDLGTGFYTDAVLKANAVGVMLGYAGKVWPAANITRQDAFVMIARALKIQDVAGYTIKASDAKNISDYAKASIAAMESLGMVHGRSDGKLYPLDPITRAEVVQVLDNIIASIYSAAGTYSANATGYVVINTSGVVLKDMTINGTLVVAPGVGDGDCTLNNVTIIGGVVVLGGGANSFKILGSSSISGSIIIDRIDGVVRVYTADGVEIPVVIVEDGSDDIILEGSFKNVTVKADVTVTLPAGTIVENLTLEAPAAVTGTGAVKYATVTAAASGASFVTAPTTTEVKGDATATVAGKEMNSGNDDVAEQPSGGNGGDAAAITVTKVTLHFSDSSDKEVTPSGTTAAFDLSNETDYPGSLAITGITVTTSSATRYCVGTYSIATNAQESMSSMLAMAGIDSGASVTLGRIRNLGKSVEITGSVTGGGTLSVLFQVASTGYYTITNDGTTVTAVLTGDTTIASFAGTNDPVAMLIRNLDSTASLYRLTATKTGSGLSVTREYTSYNDIKSFTITSIADIVRTNGYSCTNLSDLSGITVSIFYGSKTVTLILKNS